MMSGVRSALGPGCERAQKQVENPVESVKTKFKVLEIKVLHGLNEKMKNLRPETGPGPDLNHKSSFL